MEELKMLGGIVTGGLIALLFAHFLLGRKMLLVHGTRAQRQAGLIRAIFPAAHVLVRLLEHTVREHRLQSENSSGVPRDAKESARQVGHELRVRTVRFHVVALPHTQTNMQHSACAVTTKIPHIGYMMHSLGHEMIHYGVGTDVMTVEYGIGYNGTFAKYRVFESYAHIYRNWGAKGGYDPDGKFYDAVIPNYLNPDDYPFKAEKQD